MYAYQDRNLPVEERIRDLLSHMSPEEKVGQLIQLPAVEPPENMDLLEPWGIGSYLHCQGLTGELQARARKTRLGIPLLFGIDAIHGHCFQDGATVFPTQLAMSSSWDSDLLYKMARVTAREVRAAGIHWTFSPVLCVGRDTRWGRINETFGEDPWLCGDLALAMIRGYQNDGNLRDGIMACAKHYVAYGETLGGRDSYEAEISQRKLLDVFLPPFERAVREGEVASLMTGYHSINGQPCTVNQWLLREQPEAWGFKGFVVTDWDNVNALIHQQRVCSDIKESALKSFKSGNHMIMTSKEFYPALLALYREGLVSQGELDAQVAPILRYKFMLGLFDEDRFGTDAGDLASVGSSEHWDIALEASKASMVLLKNEGQTLPLATDARVLLCGPNADNFVAQLGDWSFGSAQANITNPDFHRRDFVSILDGMRGEFPKLLYNPGCDVLNTGEHSIPQAVELAMQSDVIVAVVGDTKEVHGEGRDRANLDLGGAQLGLLQALKATGKPLVVVLVSSKPLCLNWVKEHADAFICCFNPGSKGGVALAETLSGKHNPSGKLTISFPEHSGQIPVYYNSYSGWHIWNDSSKFSYCDTGPRGSYVFGQGLSYSKFSYANLVLAKQQLAQGEGLRFSVELTNESERAGTEIIQVYLRDEISSVTRPIKELKAYRRVSLGAGERQCIHFELEAEAMSFIDNELERVVEAGDFQLFVGASSLDKDLLSHSFSVTA